MPLCLSGLTEYVQLSTRTELTVNDELESAKCSLISNLRAVTDFKPTLGSICLGTACNLKAPAGFQLEI